MKNVKMLALAGATFAAMTAGSVQAEQYYGFMDVSLNYLDWSDKAEDRSNNGFGGAKEDFFYLEIEGGAGYDWGDVYGFVDFENPQNTNTSERDFSGAPVTDSFRIAAKGSIAYNIGKSNWNAYGHIYSLTVGGEGFFDQNIVVGASYDINTESGFWMKPFLGLHYENQTFSGSGFNGYMAGWVLGYNFKAMGQDFMVSQWHETEFAREDQFRGNGTEHTLKSVGQNGAVALWWNMTPKFTTGIQYRYADNKLGTAAYHDAIIYTAKYNF
ncbi:ion channel protein Tsx [Parashewanella spongiae]|uniref:Ion channel protein Tsx n=2 Tax=Parashewanella spongiae TaxID=342950 RepID=A0A3A6TPM5_9GAMM|nr:outer membrane protein OmpK [Parashewanella spongiae]RJY07131.1 ion channel protein Tsx [Parashewanella spongiae]